MDNCTCENKNLIESLCLCCSEKFFFQPSETNRQLNSKHLSICGVNEGNTCDKCTEKGLVYVSGYGGPPYILDKNTDVKTFVTQKSGNLF